MDGSSEALRPLRVADHDDQPSGGSRPVQIGSRDGSERRGIAPATTLGLDEHFHRHARDVTQRLGEESRFPIRRGRENHRGRFRAYVERKETRVITRLGVTGTIEPDFENLPTGKGEAGSGKGNTRLENSTIRKRYALRC